MEFNTDLIDGKTVFVVHNVECLERLLQYAEMGELDIEVETQGIRWAIEAYEDQKTCYSEKTMAIRPEIDSRHNSIYFNRSSVGYYMENGFVVYDFDDMLIGGYEKEDFEMSDMDISAFM